MMSQHHPLHIAGLKVATDPQTLDTNIKNIIQQLKYELSTKKSENKKLVDQLNCLISLIKRSWAGDKHAILHLSNIVGMEPPSYLEKNNKRNHLSSDGALPSPHGKKDTQEHLQQYVENREAFMDAVLEEHEKIMSGIPLHHRSDSTVDDVSLKLFQFNKILRDVQYQAPATNTNRRPMSSTLPRHPTNLYNDPGRYTQSNLFTLNEHDGVKKQRPVSSSNLKAGDIIRSRPRSGYIINKNNQENQEERPVFTVQKYDRPLKYETTRPVSCKPRGAYYRGHSADEYNRKTAGEVKSVLLTDIISSTSKTVNNDLNGRDEVSNENGDNENGHNFHEDNMAEENQFVSSTKPPSGNRMKSAFQRRPAFIDEFAKDEQNLKDIQDNFRKTALSLQKRLGIDDSGLVI